MPRRSHIKKRIIEGRCIDCGEWAEFGKLRCVTCLNEQNFAAKEKYKLNRMREKLAQANPRKSLFTIDIQ